MKSSLRKESWAYYNKTRDPPRIGRRRHHRTAATPGGISIFKSLDFRVPWGQDWAELDWRAGGRAGERAGRARC